HRPANDTRGFPKPGFESRKTKFHRRIRGDERSKAGAVRIAEIAEGIHHGRILILAPGGRMVIGLGVWHSLRGAGWFGRAIRGYRSRLLNPRLISDNPPGCTA